MNSLSKTFCLFAGLATPLLVRAEDERGTLDPQLDVVAAFREAHDDFVRGVRRFTPMLEASAAYLAEAEVRHEDGEFDLFHVHADALVPLPLGRDTFLLGGALAGARHYDFEGVDGVNDDTLFHAGLALGAGHFFTDDFVLQGYWQPSIYSDIDTDEGSLNSDDWKLWYGTILSVYRSHEHVYWKLGVTFTDAINSGALPLIGVAWEFAPSWRLDILAPRTAEVSFSPNERWILHTGFRIDGDEYHLRLNDAAGNQQSDVRVQEVRYIVGVIHRFTKRLSWSLELGATVAGNYEYTDEFDGTLEPAPYVRAGFGWTF